MLRRAARGVEVGRSEAILRYICPASTARSSTRRNEEELYERSISTAMRNCGRVHPVETGQAGGMIFCECGTKVKIPTMMRIKRLQQEKPQTTKNPKKKDEQPTEGRPAGRQSQNGVERF